MPRKAKSAAGANSTNKGARSESVGGYFRAIFTENKKLLKTRSNDEILMRWLADHPDEKEVPDRIKNILANVKSVLRHKRRKKPAQQQSQLAVALMATQETPTMSLFDQRLEQLEEQIDECLTLARGLSPVKLASIIKLLRRARHEVVWKLGE